MKNNISFLILFSLLFYSSILCANENSNLQVLMKHGKLKSWYNRAEQQVRALNKKAGYKKYESEVVHKIPAGKDARTEILKYEQERATELWQKNEIDPKIHKIPKQ